MLFSQITTLPLAVTAGYNISRNARWEQLIIPRIHGIPNRFSQRILRVSEARRNAALHNLIPWCGHQSSLRLFHSHPGSGCWPGEHPSLSTDSSKHCAVVSQPSATRVWGQTKNINKGKEMWCLFLFTHLGHLGRSEIILRVCRIWVLSSLFTRGKLLYPFPGPHFG